VARNSDRPDRLEITSPRLTLLPHEIALVLEVPAREVTAMMARGELRNASRDRWRRVGVEDAADLVRTRVAEGRCSPLAEPVLAAMAAGELAVSRQEARWLTLHSAYRRISESRGALSSP
jgi:hypothetical protein